MNRITSTLLAMLCAGALPVLAQEATIRKNLAERLPNLPKIDEISKTPIAGVYEVRFNGAEILYTDADGSYLLQGSLIDVRQRRNLTEERIDKLTAIDFASLPMKDAFTIVRGDGSRKMAVFADPNCGYCKKYEAELQDNIKNVTIHVFLYPILGPDSQAKSEAIWCAKDKGKVWLDWMLRGVKPAPASCDTGALARNVEFGRKYRINGTPATLFPNGHRAPGAIAMADVEKYLTAEAKKP